MRYRSEAAFSKALCARLKKEGVFCQRLESGGTGRGIPDLYICARAGELWLELKNMPYERFDGTILVPWRAGQQAWALDYYKARGRCPVTIVAGVDAYALVFTGGTWYKGNTVEIDEYVRYKTLADLVTGLVRLVKF